MTWEPMCWLVGKALLMSPDGCAVKCLNQNVVNELEGLGVERINVLRSRLRGSGDVHSRRWS